MIDGIPTFVPAQYVDDDRPTLTDPVPIDRALALPTTHSQILQVIRVLGILAAVLLVSWQVFQSVQIALSERIFLESVWFLFFPWAAAGFVWGVRFGRRGHP